MKLLTYVKELPSHEKLEELTRIFPELDRSSFEAYIRLIRAGMAMRSHLEVLLSRFGLSHGRFMLMAFLSCSCEKQGMTASELAKTAGVTGPTVTSVVRGMVEEGLILRQHDPVDRRTVRLRITDQGRELMDRLMPELFRRQSLVMADLSVEERLELSRLLAKVKPEELSRELD